MSYSTPPPLIDRPSRWGLLPDRVRGRPLRAREVLRHWFVHFNPLYFVSAFCILSGIWLVNRHLDGLEAGTSLAPQLVLFAVVQAYEALIIAGAAFLVAHAKAVRPAVLLVLLESAFLLDGTLRLESLVLRGASPGFGALWVALIVAKVWGMAQAMRVRLAAQHYAGVAASAAALLGVVQWLSRPGADARVALQVAAWLGAFVVVALDVTEAPPPSSLPAGAEAARRAERCVRGAFRIVAGAYFFHVWCYILVAADPAVVWPAAAAQAGTFFLYLALRRPGALAIWVAGGLVIVAAGPTGATVPYAAALVGAVFIYRVARGARGGLAAGAALALYASLWLARWPGWSEPVPPLPALASWTGLTLVAGVALAAWLVHDRLAQVLLGAVASYLGYRNFGRLVPKTELARGVSLLVAGFTTFLAGLAVNWWLRTPNGVAATRPRPPRPT
jgi:hypothetical protein